MQDDPPQDAEDEFGNMLDNAPTTPPNMYRFLNTAEAAAHLNISEDAVKQLVEQRKIFPLRDTFGFKFKLEELDRYIEDQNESSNVDESDAVDISGIEIEVGNTDSGDSNDTPEEDRCLEIGWQRDTYDSDEKLSGQAELERGTANEFDLDAGLEDDIEDAMPLVNPYEFDLDAGESSAEDPSQSADLASSQAGDSMFDKSAGPGDYSFLGEEVSADEQLENPQTDMPSSFLHNFYADDISFSAWQILALLCLVLLMLIGGITVIETI